MEYQYHEPRRFAVVIGRVRYSVARQDGGVYSGPCCDECAGTFFDVESWSSAWCVICQDCGRRYDQTYHRTATRHDGAARRA